MSRKREGCSPIYRLIPVQELRSTWLPLCWIGTILVWITWTLQDLTGGFQEINQPGGVGKSDLKTEEKSQFSLNSCTGQAGASCSWCHRNNVSSWQLQDPNRTKAIFKNGNGEIQFQGSCSYRVEFGEEGIQWGHFHFPDISEASHWAEGEIFLPPSLSSEFKAIARAWWVLML